MKTDILRLMTDPRLLGPVFGGESWAAWRALLAAAHGLPLDAEQLALFRRFTGRKYPRIGGYPGGVVAIVGRQSGKTIIAGLDGACDALNGKAGEYVALTAQDLRSSQRALFAYVCGLFEASSVLSREVVRTTADSIELRNGVTIACYPCRPASVRGIRCAGVKVDELAFFITTDGRPTDTEMLRALRPTLATTGGKMLILSSPYGQSGALWDLYRKHYGIEHSDTLIWQAAAPDMNPLLPQDYLQRMQEDDPEAYRSEVLGEFRAGIAALFDDEALAACVVPGVRERLFESGGDYVAFTDPSGGRADAFTVAIAHEPGILDCVRAWPAPFDPAAVTQQAAALLHSYGVSRCTGDRYGGEWPVEAFRRHGVTYAASERDRSAIYLELLPLVNSRSVELLDLPDLLRELRGLERRRGTAGKDRVDHRPGAHDDMANSCAGALLLAAKPHVALRAEHFFTDRSADRAAVVDAFVARNEPNAAALAHGLTNFGFWSDAMEERPDLYPFTPDEQQRRDEYAAETLQRWKARRGLH